MTVRLKKAILIYAVICLSALIAGALLGRQFQMPIHNTPVDMSDVLEHNARVALLSYLGGLVTRGVFSGMVVTLNSFVAGVMIMQLSQVQLWTVFIPYASMELLAYILFAVAARVYATYLWEAIQRRQLKYLLSPHFVERLVFSSGVIVLALAAILEGVL